VSRVVDTVTVPGFTEDWFSEESQAALVELYGLVADLDGDIIEVGSWEGKSTVALANACAPAKMYAVDTWLGSPGEVSAQLAAERDVYGTFVANIDALTEGNVVVCRMGWRMFFATQRRPIRFLFIDAEHSYDEVRANIATALPLMVKGGVICGDDNHHPPVQRAVLDTLGEQVKLKATLWWWQK